MKRVGMYGSMRIAGLRTEDKRNWVLYDLGREAIVTRFVNV